MSCVQTLRTDLKPDDTWHAAQLTPRPRHTTRAIAADLKGKGKAVEQDSKQDPPVDIFLSHDWPVTITRYGDEAALLRRKSFFAEEVGFDDPHRFARSLTLKPTFRFAQTP